MSFFHGFFFTIKQRFLPAFRNERGAVAVEISLVFIPFIFIIFLLFELCRIIYISSALDLAVAEASRYAAISTNKEEVYRDVFLFKLRKDIPLLPLLTDDKNIYVDVKYCSTIEDIILNRCDYDRSKKSLAIYHMGYHYELLFSIIPKNVVQSYLQRMVVFVQEYQRDEK